MKHERPCLVASGSDWLQEVLRRLLVWVVVLSSGTLMAYAGNLDISQTKVITGTVTEKETGDPLIGVNVSVKGTSKGTITNLNGQYSVDVNSDKDILVFSFIGKATQEKAVKGLKIGIPGDYFGEGLDPEVKEAVLNAAKVLEEKGAIVEEFDLSLVEYAIPAYYVIACAEASSNLARFDGVKYGYRAKEYEGLHNMYKKTRSEGFGPEVKRRIMLGSFVLSSGYYDAYYLKALRTKALIKKAFDEAFAKYDVILGPAAPTTAPKLGESLSDPIKMYLGDIYTISVNLAGLPGISLPCGKDSNGLPIGLQLIGDCFKEKKIIRAAYAFEQTREYEHSPLA